MRAVLVVSVFRLKLLTAPLAVANIGLPPVLATAMGIEGRCAIRTDDSQVLESVVVRHPIDVVQDQRHGATTPIFVLATHLAAALFQTLCEESSLEIGAGITGITDQDLGKRDRIWSRNSVLSTVKVLGRDLPNFIHPPAKNSVVPTSRAHPKAS
jgi:hypothetical protein